MYDCDGCGHKLTEHYSCEQKVDHRVAINNAHCIKCHDGDLFASKCAGYSLLMDSGELVSVDLISTLYCAARKAGA